MVLRYAKNWLERQIFYKFTSMISYGILLIGIMFADMALTESKVDKENGKGGKQNTAPHKEAHEKIPQDIFPIPDRIKNDIDFWRRVYSDWDSNQVVFYDNRTKFIYDILNLPKIDNEIGSVKYKKIVDRRFKDIANILHQVVTTKDFSPSDQLTQRIYNVLKMHSLLKEKDLVGRLRYQNGLRSQFEYGLITSGRYADDMLAILRWRNLPEDLLALVFVESLFYISAVSHAGASGPWGFLKETAIRSDIHVNNVVDERLDPIRSTIGFANYIERSKTYLPNWPLVITSYNYGYSGLMRAVKNLGTTDLGIIIDQHDSPLFGYASKSYYAEFLAAREILRNQEKYFPKLKKEAPWRYDTVTLARPIEISDLLSSKAVDRESLLSLNHGLTKRVINGFEALPASLVLRVQKGRSKHFYDRLKKVPSHRRSKAAEKISTTYRAKGKETVAYIAKRHDISAVLFSEKMKQPLEYKPKGTIRIRSAYYLTSNDSILSSLPGVVGKDAP